MIIACLLLICLQQNFENRLLNKVFMIGCMTCACAPTAGGTTAQSGQRNDGATAPNTQQLHHRLGHINRILYADIEKLTTEPDAWISRPCGRTLIWQIRVHPVCCSCRRIIQMTRHTVIIRLGDRFRSIVVSATEISCRLTRMEAFEVRLRPGI